MAIKQEAKKQRFGLALAALLTVLALAMLGKSLFRDERSLAKQKRSARDLAFIAGFIQHRDVGAGRQVGSEDLMRYISQVLEMNPRYKLDAWGTPVGFMTKRDIGAKERQWCIFSRGSDGAPDASWSIGSFRYNDYERDLVICDGEWLVWPAWPGIEEKPPIFGGAERK